MVQALFGKSRTYRDDYSNSTSSVGKDSSDYGAHQLREIASSARGVVDDILDGIRTSDLSPRPLKDEVIPTVEQSLEILDQIPDLIASIADGAREFVPSPQDTREAARRMYRARRTLLIQFENDSIDESKEIEAVLREAYTIMRMKRPLVEMEVELGS